MKLIKIESEYTGCNDGSPIGFYYGESKSEETKNKFLLYFLEGGFCFGFNKT